MPSTAMKARCGPEEYLATERDARFKSEYLDGQVVALAGASRRHNLISGNLYRELSRQLIGRPCEAYMSDMRVKAGPGLYAYPDVVAACGEILFEDSHDDTLLNPVLIVEVLSPSTEVYDRGEKFARYRRMESLQEYLLVAQDKIQVEYYRREGSRWLLSESDTLNDTVLLESVGCRIALRDVYDKVETSESDPAALPVSPRPSP